MTASILETKGFAGAVIDALSSHICVIDRDGVIVAVNQAWSRFGQENSSGSRKSDVGTHYLRVCQSSSGPGADEAEDFASGVRAVLQGRSDLFQLEYPCHSPTERRWFLGRVTPLAVEQGGAVISHLNITERKLMEFELAKLASTDSLTGLPNRRYFLDAAAREFERVRRFSGSASVMMLDLDHFKAVNDTYGHAAGDDALRSVTQACLFRSTDVFARWGGEEFVAILPETDEEGAFIIVDKLRRAVSGASIRTAKGTIHISASAGVAQVWPSDKEIAETLLRADRALYNAKDSGRNRVMRSSECHPQ